MIEIEDALFYHDNKDRLLNQLDYMRKELGTYIDRPDAKPTVAKAKARVIETIEQFAASAIAIIEQRKHVVYYTSEDLKNERHMLHQNNSSNNAAFYKEITALRAQVAALRAQLRITNYELQIL